MRRIVHNLFVQLGFTGVQEAANGASALAKLRAGNFSLVVADWDMAPMTGLQLVKAMRGDAQLNDIPFLMITAQGAYANWKVAKAAGVTDCIMKPFNAEALQATLTTLL